MNPDIDIIKQSKDQWKEKEHFLSTDDYVAGHPMPPSFNLTNFSFGYRLHLFVEYVLRVEVKQASGARMLLPPASREATLPILVRHISEEVSKTQSLPLAAQFTLPDQLVTKCMSDSSQSGQSKLRDQVFRPTVRSSRLLTWNQPASDRKPSFSFREKTKQIFNSSSLPRYTFEVTISTPETIQLLREDAVCFVISASSIKDDASTTIQLDDYPDIRIDNLSLSLIAVTYLRCKGPFSTKPVSHEIKLLDRHPVDYTIGMSSHTVADAGNTERGVGGDDRTNGSGDPNNVDLLKLPGMSIALCSAKIGRQTEIPLSVTFNTYIIAREYKLKWKLELDVAGERLKLQNDAEIPVTILPAESEDLDKLLSESDATGAANQEDEDMNDEVSDEFADDEDVDGKRSLGHLAKRKGKKTKEQEVADERESQPEQSNSAQPLLFRHDELLPRYEQNPTDSGYRHEIDDRPPGYENK